MKARLVSAPVVFVAVLILGPPVARPTVADNAASAPPAYAEHVSGLVKAVDAHARTFDLLTGVGYALRMRRVQWSPQTRISTRGTALDFSHLTPGCVVRTTCHHVNATALADTVEILAPGPAGRTR